MGPENQARGENAAGQLDDLYEGLEDEDVFSLFDLPFDNSKVVEMGESVFPDDPSFRLRTQQSAFEFFTSNKLQSDMCPADDIIVSGKLIPMAFPIAGANGSRIENHKREDVRSESLSELKSSFCSGSIKVVRSSHSLDGMTHRRSHSSFVPDLDRKCSGRSDRSSFGSPKMAKSRWQLLILGIGMIKFPPEMELRDMKNRQIRRSNPGTLFLGTTDSVSKSIARGRGSSWGLIKALSCKDHTSISVTTSYVCMRRI